MPSFLSKLLPRKPKLPTTPTPTPTPDYYAPQTTQFHQQQRAHQRYATQPEYRAPVERDFLAEARVLAGRDAVTGKKETMMTGGGGGGGGGGVSADREGYGQIVEYFADEGRVVFAGRAEQYR